MMSIHRVPTFRAAHFLPYLEYLREKGASVDYALDKFRLPSMIGDQPDSCLPLLPVLQFFSYIERKEGIRDLAMIVNNNIGIKLLSSDNQRSILSAPTLKLGLDAFLYGLGGESSTIEGWTVAEGAEVKVCKSHRLSLDDEELRPMKLHFMFLSLAVIRSFAGATWTPRVVSLRCRQPFSPLVGNRFPNTQFLFGQMHSWMTLPLEMLGIMKSRAATSALTVNALPQGEAVMLDCEDFAASLKSILKTYLAEGYPGIDLAAEISGTSVRTLQRNLAHSNMTYSKLVEHARFEAAVEMLGKADSKIIDIAYALGYQDPSHFSRAFRRLAGTSPREYRMTGAA
jgi:AraC-like DNA-binding protein